MDKLTALKQYFGHDGFRPGQQALVDGLLAGRDVFGVMPTGGGKSSCRRCCGRASRWSFRR